ncbi:MAG TPA: oxidoreductase [Nocardioidaceae bacterium]|nr:oxidoreductase [Nocardioidaceae bacterium]
MSWTPDDLPSLDGRTAVVTGANSGIGWHTAARLARSGADVTLACRNLEAAEDAAARMREQARGHVVVEQLDLASLASVEKFASGWHGPLHLLVNNAGVMTPPRPRRTADGFELQFGTNHLGHFALTARLLPALLAAESPRVVAVSSLAHHGGSGGLLRENLEPRYRPQRAYSNSKLANLLFAFELQRRASAAGTTLVSTAAHPGLSATGLVTSRQGLGAIPGLRWVAPPFVRLVSQSSAAGAAPTLFAATEAARGSYTGPQWLGESRGPVGPARLSRLARDEDLAGALWELSEERTGVHFAWPGR